MEKQLWNVFQETGDPLGYLFYTAERKKEQPEKEKPRPSGTQREKHPVPLM